MKNQQTNALVEVPVEPKEGDELVLISAAEIKIEPYNETWRFLREEVIYGLYYIGSYRSISSWYTGFWGYGDPDFQFMSGPDFVWFEFHDISAELDSDGDITVFFRGHKLPEELSYTEREFTERFLTHLSGSVYTGRARLTEKEIKKAADAIVSDNEYEWDGIWRYKRRWKFVKIKNDHWERVKDNFFL